MKLDILDAYNIRARLSPSIILLGPIALTLFLCFEDVYNLASSVIIIAILLALTNYVPVLQRYISQSKVQISNYAAEYLRVSDTTIDNVSKERYYRKLSEIDEGFSAFKEPKNTEEFDMCCKSAVIYLKNNTRDNHLVLEENINYGFCKNLLIDRPVGLAIAVILCVVTIIYSFLSYGDFASIPLSNKVSVIIDVVYFLFWLFGINKKMMEQSAKKYALALISSIDTISAPQQE